MTILAILASIFGVVSGFANLPQIWKIFKTKSAKDIAVSTYLLLAVGNIIWVLYGIEIQSIPIFCMEGIGLVEFIIILIGCYLYGRKIKK